MRNVFGCFSGARQKKCRQDECNPMAVGRLFSRGFVDRSLHVLSVPAAAAPALSGRTASQSACFIPRRIFDSRVAFDFPGLTLPRGHTRRTANKIKIISPKTPRAFPKHPNRQKKIRDRMSQDGVSKAVFPDYKKLINHAAQNPGQPLKMF